MKEAVFLCLLFVVSLASAKDLCTIQYNDTTCTTEASRDCAAVDKCIKTSDTPPASSKNVCAGDTFTTTTYTTVDCSGDGTVVSNGTTEVCVASGETSSQVTCGAGQMIINAALVGFSVAFAFLKL
eukprot:CAMPEP_0201475278 /NCGR_PEP_ID=MMETSP0151_2-20130828/723_1 /ASSEMBLY_ACC=CAM_ASM_000257 /TAXON_ID=200890 /ORGANISM="Paramoeba atlantica, Strain 621/1 / CCAP 1560/9" /LENGTH=125 /DNA_ID=CAMNT_0047855329 /DNA_START=81 /DNA_END=458 /DNA_ORIENTATION=-